MEFLARFLVNTIALPLIMVLIGCILAAVGFFVYGMFRKKDKKP